MSNALLLLHPVEKKPNPDEKNLPMRTVVLITGLVLLFVANVIMLYYAPRGLSAAREGFQVAAAPAAVVMPGANAAAMPAMPAPAPAPVAGVAMPAMPMAATGATGMQGGSEGFTSYFLENAGGAKDKYEPIGAFDGVRLSTGNNVSSWRSTAPNEPLMGPAFEPGPDSLFMFKNNQCKPECCGASFSCDGGCVCTTPDQRQYIATRGGNRTAPEDSA